MKMAITYELFYFFEYWNFSIVTLKSSHLGGFFFLSLSLLGFFFINIDLNLKSKPQLLAVSYRKHKPSHLQSLAANPSELALSQLGEKDIL